MEKPMYRDQIRRNLQRIMETTKSHWGETLEEADPRRAQANARARGGLHTKIVCARQAQGVESQDASTTPWQRAS